MVIFVFFLLMIQNKNIVKFVHGNSNCINGLKVSVFVSRAIDRGCGSILSHSKCITVGNGYML